MSFFLGGSGGWVVGVRFWFDTPFFFVCVCAVVVFVCLFVCLPLFSISIVLFEGDEVDESLEVYKRELFGTSVAGDVLEIGSGTGVNLRYYTDRELGLNLKRCCAKKQRHKFLVCVCTCACVHVCVCVRACVLSCLNKEMLLFFLFCLLCLCPDSI